MKLIALALAATIPACPLPPQDPEPTPSPTATPGESPAPEPTAEPSALPTPSPAPSVASCDLPPSDSQACELDPHGLEFREDVIEAQRLAANNGFVVDGIVVNEIGYTREVSRILRVMGLCAISGADKPPLPPDETIVKESNSFSAHWDIVNGSDGSAQTHPAARCEDAAF